MGQTHWRRFGGRFAEALKRAVERLAAIPRVAKQTTVYLIDIALCALAMEIAFCLRLGTIMDIDGPVAICFGIAAIAWTASALVMRVYNNVFRFAGSGAIMALVRTIALSTVVLVAIIGTGLIFGAPRTVAIIHPVIFLILLFFFRLFIRYTMIDILEQFNFVGHVRHALIYGAGAAGRQLAVSLKYEPGLQLVGYIDDNETISGHQLDGAPIWHNSEIAERVRKYSVTDILLALPTLSRSRRRDIIAQVQGLGVHVMALPPLQQMMDGSVSIQDLREIDLEDLLGRAPVPPDELLVSRAVQDKTVLITGAGGSIGSELCRQIIKARPRRIVLCEMNEFSLYAIERELSQMIAEGQCPPVELAQELLNVAEARPVATMFERYRPETVFHAAAYKHVPLVENNPIAGLRNNIFGTLNCAEAAERCGAERFILVSTDKAVRPTNIMGASKRGCELILQAMAARGSLTRFAMVRFGNVLGSSGSVVPLFREQIANGGPITITHRDITRYFMTIPEAALLVLQAGAMAEGGEVYVLDMGESVRIYDLARTMIQLSGSSLRDAENPDGDIEIVEIGLRPGEKLFEELLIGNSPLPTQHPRIMQAHEKMLLWPEISDLLAQMAAATTAGDASTAIAVISQMVPEYAPEKQAAPHDGPLARVS